MITPRQPSTRRPRRGIAVLLARTARILVLLALIVAVIIGGPLAYFYFSSPTVRDTLDTMVAGIPAPEKAFPGQDEINLLFMGRDVDRDRHGRVLNTHGRTDAMMLAHFDFSNRSVSILSIPRDTLVRIPGYHGKLRINSANALGGPELALDTVARFLGVQPDYYVLVNFQGFEKAIDRVGGLEVTVDKQLDYDDNWGDLHIHLKPGRQALNGEQAMGFVRYRQSNDGDGESDLVRISRQQELLRSARAKLTSPKVILKIPGALDAVRSDMEGNLTHAQLMCLACFMRSLPSDSGIRMETIPALNGGGVFVHADPEATRKLVRQMFYHGR